MSKNNFEWGTRGDGRVKEEPMSFEIFKKFSKKLRLKAMKKSYERVMSKDDCKY